MLAQVLHACVWNFTDWMIPWPISSIHIMDILALFCLIIILDANGCMVIGFLGNTDISIFFSYFFSWDNLHWVWTPPIFSVTLDGNRDCLFSASWLTPSSEF